MDSFNKVFPLEMREYAAMHFNKYRDFIHRVRPSDKHCKDKYWPAGGITSKHYDTFIAVNSAMGLIGLKSTRSYWNLGDRFSVPFVRRAVSRDFYELMKRYAHFNDADQKVLRGDRNQPPPQGYDILYNFRPMMDKFNACWSSLMELPRTLCLDEKMIKLAMRTLLSRRQPNKPIRDGVQVYCLSDSKGRWLYNTWIDQGDLDPNLAPPYHYGKQIAMILHLCKGARVFGTWTTIAMDQAFTSPSLAMIGCWLKFLVVGTCRTMRRAWPTTQFAEVQKQNGKVVKPGDTAFLHHVGEISHGEKKTSFFMTACMWYDKNVVHMLSNRHDAKELPYAMKHKGRAEALDTTQPALRAFYTSHKVGVDVIDQQDAAAITSHRTRRSPWHRVHDAYCNTAMTLAVQHYRVVIQNHGTDEQKKKLKRLSSNELRWRLLEDLVKGSRLRARSGSPSIPQK